MRATGESLELSDTIDLEEAVVRRELSATDSIWCEDAQEYIPLTEWMPHLFSDQSTDFTQSGLPADLVSAFCSEGQKEKMVQLVLETFKAVAAEGEQMVYIATQRKPLPDIAPEAIALSSQRLFLFEKGHFKSSYEAFELASLLAPKIKTGMFFGHIHFSAGSGESHGIRFIPKKQAARLFGMLKNYLEAIRSNRAHSSHGLTSGDVESASTSAGVQEATTPAIAFDEQTVEIHDHAIHHRLETLKQMLEEGLIDPEDYEKKKRVLLEQL